MTANTKDNIRDFIRSKRTELKQDWLDANSHRICESFTKLPEYKASDVVCLYMPITGEVNLKPLLKECWSNNKRVLTPAYRANTKDYGFKAVNPDSEMKEGLWGVPEPKTKEWADIGETPTCIAVPGLAFDQTGKRLGHGKGYYDRLLTFTNKHINCTKIGVCFDFQIIESIPSEEWDIDMDIILSESRIYRVADFKNSELIKH